MTIEEKAREYANANYPEIGMNDDWIDDGFDEGYNAAGNGVAEKAYIAGVKEATRWIPVNESLPEHHPEMMLKESEEDLKYEQSKDVLVKYANGATDTGLRYRFLTMDDEYTDLSFSWSCCGEVTHWRPIEPEIM